MSHNLTIRKNGQVEHAYVGEVGWHKLGNKLVEGASVEEWLKAAGMDWTVLGAPVMFSTGGESAPRVFKGRKALYRSDNFYQLGIVGDIYKIVQPREALEFFSDLSDYKLNTAGTMKGGKKYWALAKIGETTLPDGDKIKSYLLFATAADGSMGTIVKHVATRVVCNNTFTAALGENGEQIVIQHRSKFDAVKVKEMLGLGAQSAMAKYIAQAHELQSKQVTQTDAEEFVAKLLGIEDRSADNTPKAFQSILDLFNGAGKGSDLWGSRNTAWGLLNGVTEYVDHHVKSRTLDNRVDSALFGSGDMIKRKAMQILTREEIAV